MSQADHDHVGHAALASGSLDEWVEWLKASVKAYYAENSVEDRLDAFAPLDVDPLSTGPAGDIARQLNKMGRAASKTAPKAVVELLRTWSVERDGRDGAILLLELAISLGSLNLFQVLMRILNQITALPDESQHDFIFLAASAAGKDCLKMSEIAGLLRRICQMPAARPWTIAEIAVALTQRDRDNLDSLPVRLLEILPDFGDSTFQEDIAEAIARKLQMTFQIEHLRRALAPRDDDPAEAKFLRRQLFQCVFPFEGERSVEPDFIDSSTREELESRWNEFGRGSAQRVRGDGDRGPGS